MSNNSGYSSGVDNKADNILAADNTFPHNRQNDDDHDDGVGVGGDGDHGDAHGGHAGVHGDLYLLRLSRE